MPMRFRMRKGFSIGALIASIATVFISLYVGGMVLQYILAAMNGTCSPFYKGLSLVGVTVGSATCSTTGTTDANTITSPAFSSGVLVVVGLVAVAGLVLRFVKVKMN